MGLSNLFSRKPIPAATIVETDSGPITVAVRINARARAYRLSVTARGAPVLTLPKSGRWGDAEAFLMRNRGWLEKRLTRIASVYSIVPGGSIPLRGVDHDLLALDAIRGTVERVSTDAGWLLRVPGGQDHMRRRLIDWLKAEAARDLDLACARHAATLGVSVAAIRLRDQSTRWGSCSSTRTLNFNWRLVLAPEFVLDYVAAHEVAHIVEMNHKPVFWRTVARTLPDYELGRAWLKQHGSALMTI